MLEVETAALEPGTREQDTGHGAPSAVSSPNGRAGRLMRINCTVARTDGIHGWRFGTT